MPNDRIFKSVYPKAELERLSHSDEEPFRVIKQTENKSSWSDFWFPRLRELIKLVNLSNPTRLNEDFKII